MAFPIAADKIEHRHYINGEFVESSDGGKFELHSPFSHNKIIDVCEATVDDTNRAVAAAKAAFPAWAATGVDQRGALLHALAAKIREAAGELAQLNAMDMGRPVSTYFDPYVAAMYFDHFAQKAHDAKGETSLTMPGFVNMTFRQPIGPVAAIIPWNVPTMSFAMKIAPAVAAGCTIVLKSSEKAPLTPARLAQLVHEVGFPPGVINVISGHGTPAGATLASHMDIRMINFTGSTLTGRKIQAAAASSNLKKVVLELGGKSPVIIFDDADITRAAADTAASMMMLSGQACVMNSRIYVHETIAEPFKKAFVQIIRGFKKGDPLSPETQQGPQADQVQFDRIKTFLDAASKGQGKLETGGEAVSIEGQGFFIEPTVYSNAAEDEKTQIEEVFGPFVNINTFTDEKDVVQRANNSEYGLYAAVYTKDISRALRVAQAFESGMVGVNCTSPTFSPSLPFGGYKGSGQGREGFGISLDEHLEVKSVLIKID